MTAIPCEIWQTLQDSVQSVFLYVADRVKTEFPNIPMTLDVRRTNEFYPLNGGLEFVKAPNTDEEVIVYVEISGYLSEGTLTIMTEISRVLTPASPDTIAQLPPVELMLDSSRVELVRALEQAIYRSVDFVKTRGSLICDLLRG